MRTIKLALAAGITGVLLASHAFADAPAVPDPSQPASIQQIAFEYDSYLYFAPEDAASESPSDAPPTPPAEQEESPAEVGCQVACDSCCEAGCRSCQPCCGGFFFGGWLDQGITLNFADPNNRFNGPVTFNDRSDEYQMNQLYLYAGKEAYTGGYGWDIGGRVDLLYGTDGRFTQSLGLDDDWTDDSRFYKFTMPQLYADVAFNNLTVRAGHFYAGMSYESPMAVENFFYSHTYMMQYGAPFTYTGALAMYDLNQSWRVSGGFSRGWDNWEDNNDNLDFIGDASWTSRDRCTSLKFGITTGKWDNAGDNNMTAYTLVFSHYFSDRLQWVMEHNYGYADNAVTQLGTADAEWYGISNYLLYQLNCRWAVGVRYEWFSDDDGWRVDDNNAAGGPPAGMLYNGVPYHWNDIALGVRWTPRSNVLVRSEVRYDWAGRVGSNTPVNGPFNDDQDRKQWLWSIDAIVNF